jgi:membrane dipeptidase
LEIEVLSDSSNYLRKKPLSGAKKQYTFAMISTDKLVCWEAHTCLPLHPSADFTPIDQLHAAGVTYASINVGMDMNPLEQILSVIAAFRARIAASPDKYIQASTIADINEAHATNKIALGFDLEGALPLLEQPSMVALFAHLGVKQIHFAYNRNNSVADGCHDVERGLTSLGKDMVRAVNQAGMLMDCSHTGRRCSLDIMQASAKPVIFSHANPQALVEHGRNISDEQIKAIAATNGVVCISGVSAFLGAAQPNATDLARHAAYVADLVGAEHVGIGMDNSFRQPKLNDTPAGTPSAPFDSSYWWPAHAGYRRGVSPMRYPSIQTWQELPQALAQVGMQAKEIKAVLGSNMMRVAAACW